MDKPTHAYIYAKQAAQIPYPEHDILFISDDVYRWQALDEYVSTAFYAHDFEDGRSACLELLNNRPLPKGERNRIQQNLTHYENVLDQKKQQKKNEVIVSQQSNVLRKMELAKEKREVKEKRKNRVKKGTRLNSKKNKYKKRVKK